MPCSDSARLLRPHLMRQAGWLPAEGLRLWDTCRHRTRRSAVAPTGTRGGARPGGLAATPTGHVAAPDPFPSGERGPGALTSSKAQASWRSGFHMWGSRTSPRGFGTCPRESRPVEAGPEHFVQVDTWQRRTCHLVESGPGGRCPQLSGLGFCAQVSRGLVRGYG